MQRFADLRFSLKHEATPNPDSAARNWPEIYFWTEGLMLLNWVQAVLRQLPSLGAKVQERFWQGSMPAQFRKDFPWMAKLTPAQAVEYCRIRQSEDRARTRLLLRASGEKEKREGEDSEISYGDLCVDEKRFVINEAAKFKRIGYPDLIYKSAKANDVRFFIRLGKALQKKQEILDVDWKRADPVACFLVENWCQGRAYDSRGPALCFFSDPALADFCSAAFGRNKGNPSPYAVRQWRRRLDLKQATSPKVNGVTISGGEILFTGGK
jgi:hypothetical protein